MDATQLDMKNILNVKLEEKYGYRKTGLQHLIDIFWNEDNLLRLRDIENMEEEFSEYFSDGYVLK